MKKYYIEQERGTLHYGFPSEIERDHPDAVEIPNPPGEDYSWNGREWIRDISLIRENLYPLVIQELVRIQKFLLLPVLELTLLRPILDSYIKDLQELITAPPENPTLPPVPPELEEEAFFGLRN